MARTRDSADRRVVPNVELALASLAAILVVGVAGSQGLLVGLLALIAVAFGLFVLRVPAAGAVCIVALVPAIAGLKRGMPLPGLRLSEVLVVGLAALVLLRAPRAGRLRWLAFDWFALAYATATLGMGLLAAQYDGLRLGFDDYGQLLGPLQFVLMYRAAVVGLSSPAWRRRAVNGLLFASVPVSVLALLQSAGFPPVVKLLVTLTGVDFGDRSTWALARIAGPFPHWTVLGGYEFGIVIIAAAVLLNGRGHYSRAIAIAALALGAIALTLTLTIGSIAGAIVGVLMLARWSDRLLRVAVGVAIAGVLLGLAFAPRITGRADEQFTSPATTSSSTPFLPHTVANRVAIWSEQYLPALKGRYILGFGPRLPSSIDWGFAESIYIAMLMRGGLPLLAVYLAMMWTLALAAWRRCRSPDPDERMAARALFTMVTLLALMQITAPQFILSGLPHAMWGLAGLMMSVVSRYSLTATRDFTRPATRSVQISAVGK